MTWVSAVHRSAVHDGPGLRTTVFVQGCHLRCRWCHNPETWSREPQLRVRADRCVACGGCVPGGGEAEPDACPSGARTWSASAMEVADIMALLERDREIFGRSGGGLTISGGEPFDQFDFTRELLQAAGAARFHRCLDTSGHAAAERFDEVLGLVDCWLFDWKVSDPVLHRRLVGVDQAPIRRNLESLQQYGARVVLRCPLVPGLNDDIDHMKMIADLSQGHDCIEAVELMPYHRHGSAKAREVGLAAGVLVHGQASAGDADRERWAAQLVDCGCTKLSRG